MHIDILDITTLIYHCFLLDGADSIFGSFVWLFACSIRFCCNSGYFFVLNKIYCVRFKCQATDRGIKTSKIIKKIYNNSAIIIGYVKSILTMILELEA
jgi:hypothetical protein